MMPLTEMTLSEIATYLEAELVDAKDPGLLIKGIAPVELAGPGMVTFIASDKYVQHLSDSQASAIICTKELAENPHSGALLIHDNPYLAFARLMQKWFARPQEWSGVHERACVEDGVELGEEVSIGPFVHVARGAKVGERVVIGSGSSIGPGAVIGDDTVIHANVSVYDRCRIGARNIIHSGAVIGSDGFGFATDLRRGVHEKIPQMGIVVVEDDVEIGANTTIDRAVLGETKIGAGTKIDNQVQIAHNVQVGRGCFLVSQVGVSGSSKLGNFVVLAGQVGVVGHITIGDQAQVGAQSGVTKDLPAGIKALGSPAMDGGRMKRIIASYLTLPELRSRVRKLEKRLDNGGAP